MTTDGRVFSWGGFTPSLGREQGHDSQHDRHYLGSQQNILGSASDVGGMPDVEDQVGEVEFISENGNPCSPIVQIATGRTHVIALDTTGKIYSWGRNDFGQLGLGQTRQIEVPKLDSYGRKHAVNEDQIITIQDRPAQIKALKDKQICQIYAGDQQSFAVTRDGEVFAWGNNKYKQLLILPSKSAASQMAEADTEASEQDFNKQIVFKPRQIKFSEYAFGK